MKNVIMMLSLTVLILAADSCRSSREVTYRSNRENTAMGRRDRTIKTDKNGVVIKTETDRKNADGDAVKTKRERTIKNNDNGTTVKVKKEKKKRNRDRNNDGLALFI